MFICYFISLFSFDLFFSLFYFFRLSQQNILNKSILFFTLYIYTKTQHFNKISLKYLNVSYKFFSFLCYLFFIIVYKLYFFELLLKLVLSFCLLSGHLKGVLIYGFVKIINTHIRTLIQINKRTKNFYLVCQHIYGIH